MISGKSRVRRDHVPYDLWEKQGLFHITEGNVVDYEFVRKTINELAEQYHICEIGVDRWNATQLITELAGDGFTMVPIGMGFKDMSPGMKELYRKCRGGDRCSGEYQTVQEESDREDRRDCGADHGA